jgi:hypothetical protein
VTWVVALRRPEYRMSPTTRHAVFTFENAHEEVAAEDILRRAGIRFEPAPPPHEVDPGCGLALRILLGDLAATVAAFASTDAPWQAIYELGFLQEVVAKLG